VLTERIYRAALTSPSLFRTVARPYLYMRCGGDAEEVHDLAIRQLRGLEPVLESISERFDFPDLRVDVAGASRMPFGTAAGFDKDGEALYPLSLMFGFEEPGTVVLRLREGNPRPRVAASPRKRELYNALGFPSRGAESFAANAKGYRERGGKAPLLVSICGIPPSPDALDAALDEVRTLVDVVGPQADGFVWNPFSPNTAALAALKSKESFRETAEVLKARAGRKMKLVKMGPFDGSGQTLEEWSSLLQGWMEAGGDGVVVTNTLPVPRSQVPLSRWGYETAGLSGRPLRRYRDAAIREARSKFPEATIIATGGIDTGEEAWKAFEAGADLLEGYTPFVFEGFGVLIRISRELRAILRQKGYSTLAESLGRP
jgi:dihydroorotate dehydrogenase